MHPGDLVGGKYRVERTLGAGGMGVVVAATQVLLDRPVALKFLLPKVLERPGLVTRFAREARAAAKLESEHVARVLDVGTLEDGAPFIVMEYLEGQDLASFVASRGPLPCEEAVGYMLQACEAVAEAHALGIVHRDLKPGNLFLANRTSGPAVIKVLDFGLSKFAHSGEENVTSESGILGSPLYMSPEQLMSARTADARSDIWSLGVVLYELLAAQAPFQYERIAGLVAAILQKPHVPIEECRNDVPGGLRAIVNSCLEKDPARRPSSIAHFARALGPFGPPGSERSVERVVHVLRGLAPATEREIETPATVQTEPDAPVAPPRVAVVESVAGSARTIRDAGVEATLPAGPVSRPPPTRARGRAGIIGGLAVAGVAATAAFFAFSTPTRDTDRGSVTPSARVAAGSDGSLVAPPAEVPAVESALVPLEASTATVATPLRPRAAPADSGPKRPRPAPMATPSTLASTPAPSTAPPAGTVSDDPLRRLKTM